MKLSDISSDINEWFNGTGPLADIVISSRIRLARNVEGHKFLSRCGDAEKSEILDHLKNVLMELDLSDKTFYLRLGRWIARWRFSQRQGRPPIE